MKYMKQIHEAKTERMREIDVFTITIGDFNNPISKNRTRQKIKKKIEELTL